MKRTMNITTAGYLVIFGFCLIFLGVSGYVTHPEKAITALVFGGGSGVLWMLLGFLGAKGLRWCWPAALVTTVLLASACVWRASLSWVAVANGQSERTFAPILTTLMFGVAGFMFFFLLKDRKVGGLENHNGQDGENRG